MGQKVNPISMRLQANKRHILEKKPSTRTRRLTGEVEVAKSDRDRINRMLGNR